MSTLTPQNSSLEVFTYKEGLLSAVAHDLRISVTDYEVTIDDGEISLRADAASLQVASPQKDGVDHPSLLRDADLEKINKTIAKEVLSPRKYPEILFSGNYDEEVRGVEGELRLHGHSRHIESAGSLDGDDFVAVFELNQPNFGIKPYSAMLGALKIKPVIRVVFRAPIALLAD